MIIFISLLLSSAYAADQRMETFKIDLDKPPSTRWRDFLISNQDGAKYLLDFVDKLSGSTSKKALSYFLLKSNTYSHENIIEMKAASAILNIDFNSIVLGNFMYEFFCLCSSFLVRNDKDQIIFGRNLDYDVGLGNLSNYAVNVDFYRSNKLLYKAVTFPGYFGITTGMRLDSFAIALNQRDLFDAVKLWDTVSMLTGGRGTTFAIRHALESMETYEEAVDYLKSVQIISGAYLCVGGLKEGVIITRNRYYAVDVLELDEKNWFLVQTNYDHWLPQPKNDDRYNPAIKRFEKRSPSNINEKVVYEFLSMSPTLNRWTIFTVMMNPSTGYWFSRTRI